MEEKVDTLTPPKFVKSGVVKPRSKAFKDGNWLGTFNLWIVQDKPTPTILYQLRNLKLSFFPNKLDVSVGGHYQAGEDQKGGLREVKEELNKTYDFGKLSFLGRRMFVSPDLKKVMRHYIVDIFMVLDNSPLESYKLQKDEVYAIFFLPIDKLIKVHTVKNYTFKAKGIKNNGENMEVTVKKDSFPYNFDDYHHKIALLAKRFLNKKKKTSILVS
ncbi:NUDIX domain-containing protein [Patescibacteria group bacterium]|nr:NUDIX domain-containing protein [Patescibacteria group bacterium]MBU2036443.1 NUDIX domain-containing protein [Patescibacteria group bacterium]